MVTMGTSIISSSVIPNNKSDKQYLELNKFLGLKYIKFISEGKWIKNFTEDIPHGYPDPFGVFVLSWAYELNSRKKIYDIYFNY